MNDYTTIQQTINVNPITGILNLLSIIGLWKIFEDNGQKGWKSIIPFYSDVILGRTCDEESLGKKLAISKAILVLFAFAFVFFFIFLLASAQSSASFEITEEYLTQIENNPELFVQNNPAIASGSSFSPVFILILLLGFIVSTIVSLVYYIKLHYRFTLFNNAPGWWIAAWIFIPSIAYIYFAFIHNNYNIPGITERGND